MCAEEATEASRCSPAGLAGACVAGAGANIGRVGGGRGSGGTVSVVPGGGNIEVLSVAAALDRGAIRRVVVARGPLRNTNRCWHCTMARPATLCVMPLPYVIQSSGAGVPDWPGVTVVDRVPTAPPASPLGPCPPVAVSLDVPVSAGVEVVSNVAWSHTTCSGHSGYGEVERVRDITGWPFGVRGGRESERYILERADEMKRGRGGLNQMRYNRVKQVSLKK